MAAIDDLVAQVSDPALRKRIQTELRRASKRKKFGLVFEEHLPECTPLYDVPLTPGRLAARQENLQELYYIEEINGETAHCIKRTTREAADIPVEELVSVAEFGDPIYPYLAPIDTVENAPDSDLWHTLIEADNYHALQLLGYLYAGKVDCIYIDPPYNTGESDWKYNDQFIDSKDSYRHSKWLSFIKKRLHIAKKLLSINGSIIISIGYQEVHRLILLCDEIFPGYAITCITVQTSGGKPNGGFTFVQEYLVYITPKGFIPQKMSFTGGVSRSPFEGFTLSTFYKTNRPNQAYPIFIDKKTNQIVKVGKSLQERIDDGTYTGSKADFEYNYDEAPEGTVAVWPITSKGKECVWRFIPSRLKNDWKMGYIKVSINKKATTKNKYSIQYLPAGVIEKIKRQELLILGKEPDSPTLILGENTTVGNDIPTIWSEKDFYTSKGSSSIKEIFHDDRFPYPKSIEYIKEILRGTTSQCSLIVDFFAGTGTTAIATCLLNAEDNGHRRCILVTNNEVSDKEEKLLKKQGYKPTDKEWQRLGIARYVTWPRTVCSIEGHDVNGQPLKGKYLGSNRPMADGFAANAAFFRLGFLDKHSVARGEQLKKLLPVLWMKAGAIGAPPKATEEHRFYLFPRNRFAVLINPKYTYEFTKALREGGFDVAFIITDYESEYRSITDSLNVKQTYQLYRDYLENFAINTGRN